MLEHGHVLVVTAAVPEVAIADAWPLADQHNCADRAVVQSSLDDDQMVKPVRQLLDQPSAELVDSVVLVALTVLEFPLGLGLVVHWPAPVLHLPPLMTCLGYSGQ